MKNFIFISPNFPTNYFNFCRELKNNGVNVLGIGDCPYENLSLKLKESLNEYYYVQSLEDYDAVYKAVAFFAFKYGTIDFIESNNEYWLERDALLRTAFNVRSGFMQKDVKKIKYKSHMKKYFEKAGLKCARYHVVKSLTSCQKFIEEVGYPVIAKPDNGVGANGVYKIKNEDELKNFLETKSPAPYVMEEFIDGEVNTYDAVIDSEGNPLFETGNVTVTNLMDVVNKNGNSVFYIVNEPFADIRECGRKVVKSFNVKSRFVHFEFFRLNSDQKIGKKGEVIPLEVNMRPSGGISPDMMNYANSVNVYKIWADMIAFDSTQITCGEKFFCIFVGRRDGLEFEYCEQDIIDKYSQNIKIIDRVPQVLSGAMGNVMYVASFKTKKDLEEFRKDILKAKA